MKASKKFLRIAALFLTVAAILLIVAIFCTACGTSGGGGGGTRPDYTPPDPWAQITCSGCPDPAPATWLWTAGNFAHLKIDGIVADNAAMQGFATYPEIMLCILQWNGPTASWKKQSCIDYTGVKPGAYNSEYFVWDGVGEFCINDKWCQANGPAYIELYADDGINPPWSVYAVPGIYPPYL